MNLIHTNLSKAYFKILLGVFIFFIGVLIFLKVLSRIFYIDFIIDNYINILNLSVQLFIVFILLLTARQYLEGNILAKKLNQEVLLNDLIKSEWKLRDDWDIISSKEFKSKKEKEEAEENKEERYFNFYEHLAISVIHKRIDENIAKIYFLDPLKTCYENFQKSNFKNQDGEVFANLKGLFKRWNIAKNL